MSVALLAQGQWLPGGCDAPTPEILDLTRLGAAVALYRMRGAGCGFRGQRYVALIAGDGGAFLNMASYTSARTAAMIKIRTAQESADKPAMTAIDCPSGSRSFAAAEPGWARECSE